MGSAGFTLLSHACLPACLPCPTTYIHTLLCDIIKAKHFLILEIFFALPFAISLTPTSLTRIPKGQSSRIRIRRYIPSPLFDNKHGEYDLTKHAVTFSSFLFSLLRTFFSFFLFFFLLFRRRCLVKSAKPDVLEQRITVPGVNERWH